MSGNIKKIKNPNVGGGAESDNISTIKSSSVTHYFNCSHGHKSFFFLSFVQCGKIMNVILSQLNYE